MNYQIISQLGDLQRVCLAARDADVVMLDTEFVRTRTFFPQLGLIQMFDGENLSLIDPTVLDEMTPFVELLQDTSVLKVLHACGEDLKCSRMRLAARLSLWWILRLWPRFWATVYPLGLRR